MLLSQRFLFFFFFWLQCLLHKMLFHSSVNCLFLSSPSFTFFSF